MLYLLLEFENQTYDEDGPPSYELETTVFSEGNTPGEAIQNYFGSGDIEKVGVVPWNEIAWYTAQAPPPLPRPPLHISAATPIHPDHIDAER